MEELTVVDVKPQLVAGIWKRRQYWEIAELLPKLYEHARKKGATFTALMHASCRILRERTK